MKGFGGKIEDRGYVLTAGLFEEPIMQQMSVHLNQNVKCNRMIQLRAKFSPMFLGSGFKRFSGQSSLDIKVLWF